MTDTPDVAEFTELMQEPEAREAFVEIKRERSGEAAHRRYSHVLQLVSTVPWAITQPMLAVIMDVLRMRAAGYTFSEAEMGSRLEAAQRRAPAEGAQGVAVIPLTGVIVPKADMFSEASGGTSIEKFRAMWREAQGMKAVKGIVLDVDSPGGMVSGVPEMAEEMRATRGRKPVVAVANSEMASAAYWLASQADEIVVSPSSMVGSIGVFTAHEDESARHEQAGVTTTLISAGKYKTEGSPFGPLTDDARQHVQGIVDEHYDMFVKAVARGRGVPVDAVRDGYGEGRVVTGRSALATGMADSAGSVEGTVRALLRAEPEAPALAAADVSPESRTISFDALRKAAGYTTEINLASDDPGPEQDGHSALLADEPETPQESPAAVSTSGNDVPASPEAVEELDLRRRLAELESRR